MTNTFEFGNYSVDDLKSLVYKMVDLSDKDTEVDCSNFCLNIEKGNCDIFIISVSTGLVNLN